MGLATMTKPNQRDTEVRSGFQSSTSDSMYLTLNPYHLTVLFTTLNNSPRVLLFFFFFFLSVTLLMEPMTKGQGHHTWRDAPEATVSSKPMLPGAGRWELWCPRKVCDYVRLGLSGR